MILVYSLNVTIYHPAIILLTTLSSYTGAVPYVVPGAAAIYVTLITLSQIDDLLYLILL
jgi:hypothetical protein